MVRVPVGAFVVAASLTSVLAVAEETECLSALQHAGPAKGGEQPKRHAPPPNCDNAVQNAGPGWSQSECAGPWCPVLKQFCTEFDTNEPLKMQEAFDKYSEYASEEHGIKIAVTKDHYYEMYHGNVGRKLSEYLPQGFFAWNFDDSFATLEATSGEVQLARMGSITFKLGWFRRNMFWNNVVKTLSDGGNFPFSCVEEFDDCTECPAKMVFTIKKGGIGSGAHQEWKVTDLALVKLA